MENTSLVGTCLWHVIKGSPQNTSEGRAQSIEGTEKVEMRDLGAVSNGYKPPQNIYFIHYFIVFQCFQSIAPIRGCGSVG